MPRTLNTLQVGRGLAALAVMLYHANLTLNLPKYIGRNIFPMFGAGNSGVEYFFVLSGFVILLAHKNDIGNPSKFLTFVWKRVKRIYPPLWIALLIVTPIYFIHPAFGKGEETHLWTIVSAFLVIPTHADFLIGPEWTLRHEMLFYAIFAIVIWKPRIGLPIAAIWIALCVIIPLVGFPSLPFLIGFSASRFHVLFALGALISLLFIRDFDKAPTAMLAIGLAIFATAWTLVCLNQIDDQAPLTVWTYGIGAALAILGAANLERRRTIAFPRWLIFLGEASYSIYLFHWPAISVMSKVFSALSHRYYVPDVLVFLATAGSGLAAGIAFHLLAEKPAIAFVSRWPALLKRRPALEPGAPV